MADSNIDTRNPLFTSLVEGPDAVTASDEAQIQDWYDLSRGNFAAKYGQDVADSFARQSRETSRAASALAAGASRTAGQLLTDSVRNFASGAIGGTLDLASGLTGLMGAKDVSAALARASQGVNEGIASGASLAQKAQQRDYAYRQQALNNRLDREYNEDIANGKSESAAKWARLGKEFTNSVGNAFGSGMATNMATQGLGSMVPSVVGSAGVGLGAKALGAGAKYLAPELASGIASKVAQSSSRVKGTLDALPWMTASGLVEGGGAYAQQLTEGLDRSIEDLMKNSPEFHARVQELTAAGMPLPQAREQARKDMAFAAAEQAGLRTGITAAMLGRMTSGFAKPFERGGTFAKRIGEGITEPIEETLTEGASNFFSNQATRDYLDKNQDTFEGVGQGAAEGFVGGLGMTGFQAAPDAAVKAIQAAGKGVSYGLGKATNLLGNQHGLEEESSKKVNSVLDSVDAHKDVIPTSAERSILDITKELPEMHTTAFHEVEGEDGKSHYSMSPEQGIDLMAKVKRDEEIVKNDTNDSYDSVKQQTLSALDTLGRAAVRQADKHFTTGKNSVGKQEFSEPQLQSMGNSLATIYMQDPARAEKRFRQLTPTQQEQLRNTSFNNAETQTQINTLLKRDPAQFAPKSQQMGTSQVADDDPLTFQNTSNGTTAAGSQTATPKRKFAQPVQDSSTVYNDKQPPLEKVSLQDIKANEAQPMFADSPMFQKGKDGQIYYTENEKDFFKVSPETFNALLDPNTSAEDKTNIFNSLKTGAYKNYQHFEAETPKGKLTVAITPDGLLSPSENTVYPVEEKTLQKLHDPNLSAEQKGEIIHDLLNPQGDETIVRGEADLNTEVLEKQNKYFDPETGTIREFSSPEVKEEFAKIHPGISKYATPMKRIVNLWKAKSPVESLRKILSSQESILDFFRRNKFTDASAVYALISSSRETKYKPIDTEQSVFNYKDSPINQVLQLLHPESSFLEKFKANFKLELDDSMPKEFKEAFFDENGKLRDPERMAELCAIASIQFVADVGTHSHSMKEEELRKHNFDFSIQTDKDHILDEGVYQEAAMNNFATTLRKTFGVAQNNDVSEDEFKKVFGPLAVVTADALHKAGLIEVGEQNINVREEGRIVAKPVSVVKPGEGYHHMFGSQGRILMRFLDPNFKNTWSLDPQPVKPHMHHADIPLDSAAKTAIDAMNRQGAKMNGSFTNLLQSIGSEYGLIRLFGGEPATDRSRVHSNMADWKARKGKDVSERLAFDLIREVQAYAAGAQKKFTDMVLYFNHVMLKNGRIMQEGAATPQSNKTLRVMMNFAKDTITDLSQEGKKRDIWKMVMAQNFGEKVNKKQFGTYKDNVDAALQFIEEQVGDNGRYQELVKIIQDDSPKFDGVKVPEKESELPDTYYLLKGLVEDFNKEFKDAGLGIHDVYGLNALVEGIRFAEAKKSGTLNKFDSRVFIEIDGTNDGPSNINSLYGLVMGAFSDRFILTNAKTGNHIGIDTTSQEAMTPGTDAAEVLETEGRDLHEEVAAEAVAQNFTARIQAALDDSKEEGEVGDNALRQLWVTYNMLRVFKCLGWIKENPLKPVFGSRTAYHGEKDERGHPIRTTKQNQLLSFEADLSNFTFVRDVSKVLTTVIPYGSEALGTTRQLVTTMMSGLGSRPGVYARITEGISAVMKNQDIPEDSKEILDAMGQLLRMTYDDGNFTKNDGISEKAAKNFTKHFPTIDELRAGGNLVRGSLIGKREKVGKKFVGPFVPAETLQNFELTTLGHEQLTDLFLPIFGEPAQAAVNTVMGVDAMRGAKIPALVCEIINILRQAKEAQMNSTSGGGLKHLVGKALHKGKKALRALSPALKFDSGAQIFVHKEKFALEQTPVYKKGAFSFASSDAATASSGVSGGPLTTQGAGDASMVMYSTDAMIRQGLEYLQVFDGIYSHTNDAEQVSVNLNEGAYHAQRQHIIHTLVKTLESVGETLINKEGMTGYKEEQSLHALRDALANYLCGNHFDGTARSGSKTDSKDVYDKLHRSIHNFMHPSQFVPSLRDSVEIRKIGSDRSEVQSPEEIRKQVKQDLNRFLTVLKAIEFNEELQHEVLDSMKKSVHHMSGMSTTYKQGDPLTPQQAKEKMEEFRKKFPDSPYTSFNRLLKAYLNWRVTRLAETQFKNKDPRIIEEWKALTGRDAGNTTYEELTDPDMIDFVSDWFEDKNGIPKREKKTYFKPQRYTKEDVKACFTRLALDRRENNVLAALYNKMVQVLPENIEVCLVSDPRDLPEKVRGKFTNKKLNGIYVNEGGKATIYIVSWTGDTNLLRPNGNLSRTVVHEMMHATISSHIVQYFRWPRGLTKIQRDSIKNLRDLLDDFMNESKWDGDSVPKEIEILRTRLANIADPAERLDESLAYILSNERLFEAFANYKLKSSLRHQNRLGKLIKHVLNAAKKVWKNLLHIVTGSPLDKALTADEGVALIKDRKRPMTFLQMYGANTLVLLNDIHDQDPDKTKKIRDNAKNQGFERKMLRDSYHTFERTSDFFEFLRERYRSKSAFTMLSQGKGRSLSNVSEAIKTMATERVDKEIQKINQWRDNFESFSKSFLDHPKEFAEAFVQFMDRHSMPDEDRYALYKVGKALVENLDPYSFVEDKVAATQEDLLASQEIYELLTGKSSFYTRISDLPKPESFNPNAVVSSVLLALATTHPQINNALGRAQVEEKASGKVNPHDPWETFKKFQDTLISRWVKELADEKTVGEAVNVVHERSLESFDDVDKLFKPNKLFQAMGNALRELIAKSVSLVNKPFSKGLSVLFKRTKDHPMQVHQEVGEMFRDKVNSYRNTTLSELIRDFYGRVPSNTSIQSLLKIIKGYADKVRQQNLDAVPDYLRKEFKNNNADKKLGKFLYRAVGKCNLIALDEKVAKDVCLSESVLDDRINQIYKDLTVMSPSLASKYLDKTQQLARYLVGVSDAGHNLLTNAYAIANLFGETSYRLSEPSEEVVKTIDELLSLYCLKNLSSGDKQKLRHLYLTDESAMTTMHRQLKVVHQEELEKTEQIPNSYWKINHIAGWMPRGNQGYGHYTLVPKGMVKDYRRKGYKVIKEYPRSDVDPSEPVYCMYNDLPLEERYHEGVLQGIHKTSFGFLHHSLSRNEVGGALIKNPKHCSEIFKNFHKESSGLSVIPIYNRSGNVIGYERSVPAEDRMRYLEKDADFFSGLAQYKERQRRELLAEKINETAVKMAAEAYYNASPEERKQYIDVLHSEDPIIRKGIRRLSTRTKAMIHDQFGDHFYLRADEVNTYLGFAEARMTDIWDGTFFLPGKAQEIVSTAMEAIFGIRSRYYLGRAEEVVNIVMGYARDTIVIRSGVVPLVNAVSNTILLSLQLGMPLGKIKKYYKEAVAYTIRYNELVERQREAEYKLDNATTEAERKKYDQEVNDIVEEMQHLPIYRLVKEGEYSTITAEGADYEGSNVLKDKIDVTTEALINKLGKGSVAKKAVSEALMTKGSTSYQTMTEIVNMSDWIAKYTGYRYLTEGATKFSSTAMEHDQAKNIVSTMFVDYDQPVGRLREWTNRMGLTWFWTYKTRMVASALMSFFYNPSRVLLGTIATAAVPGGLLGGTPFTENILYKLFSGSLEYSVLWGNLIHGLTMHPMALLLGILI